MRHNMIFHHDVVEWHLEQTVKRDGLRKFCRQHCLDPGTVSAVVHGKRPIQKKMAEALGYKPVTMYVKGIDENTTNMEKSSK